MKKLRTLFSLLLVCVMAIVGGICLTGCKDEERVDARIGQVNIVLNNLEKELIRMETFAIDSEIDPAYAAEAEFQRYYVNSGSQFTNRSEGYLEAKTETIEKVLRLCNNLVNNENFQFDTFYRSVVGSSRFYLLNFNDERIRLVDMLVDIDGSDVEYDIEATDIYYIEDKVTHIERLKSDSYLGFEKTTMAVDNSQFIASYINIHSTSGTEPSYYFAGTSERTGTQHIGFLTEGDTENAIKTKLEQVEEILNQYKFVPKNAPTLT